MRESIPHRILWFAIAAAVIVVCAHFAQSVSAYAQEPESTPTATTPTPSPADLDVARSLAAEEDTEGAIAAYRAYIEAGSDVERPEALLELAKLLIEEGDGASAAVHLDAYLLEAGPGVDVRDAQFLLAEALAERSDWAAALTLYDAYVDGGGEASLYARIGRTKALAALGRSAEAETEAAAVLQSDVPGSVKSALVRSLAEIYESRHETSSALEWYGRMGTNASPSEQALALWRSALIRVQTGDVRWQDDLIALVQRYPSTYPALEAVKAFPEIQTLVDGFYVGLVLYQHREDALARSLLQRSLSGASSANAARAAYYLAAIDERSGAERAALTGYASVLDIDPSIELADDALWWHGRLLEAQGDPDGARSDYQRLASDFASSDHGREARFRLALLDYDGGRYAEAAERYSDLASDLTGDERDRALLWRGKALAKSGQRDAAEEVWESLEGRQEPNLFALRAGVLLDEGTGSIVDGEVVPDAEDTDWSAIEAWVNKMSGDGNATAGAPSPSERHFKLGVELNTLAMANEADAEFESALNSAGDDGHELLNLASQAEALDLHHVKSRAASRLLDALDTDDARSAPQELWRAAYPAPFGDDLTEAADANDVPPLLLLSMIRQESSFNPRAGSPAGALGLMQVVGGTGESIAEELEISDFEVPDLYQVRTSLNFGAHYLGTQMDAFDGDIYRALAAYNGGPGNAQRWSDAAAGDPDRFYEEVDFAETRLYLKLVGENLARYQQVYGDLQNPALPNE